MSDFTIVSWVGRWVFQGKDMDQSRLVQRGDQIKEAFTKNENTAQSEKRSGLEELLWKRRQKGMREIKPAPTKIKYSLATCPVASEPTSLVCRKVVAAKCNFTKTLK